MEVISVQNLLKSYKTKLKGKNFLKDMFWPKYKEFYAVNDITFKINEGESVAFLGPNGAGKTTTIKMLTGLMSPSEGEISVLGFTPFKKESEYLKQIGLVMGSKNGLSWDLTISQNFWILQKIYEIDTNVFDKRVERMVEMLDLKDVLDNQVRKLSLGQRMKAELIASLLHSPKVLFLDEPTIGLDVTTKKVVRDFLREIQRELNVTILLTSHDMDDVEEVCDRVIIINEGKLSLDQPLDEMIQQYSKVKYINLIFQLDELAEEFRASNTKYEINKYESNTVRIKVPREDFKQALGEIVNINGVKDIDLLSVPLDEIIRNVFAER